ncbi:hypothetical protein PHLCEN_2v3295, partial [Hermanssonia centrifuga]
MAPRVQTTSTQRHDHDHHQQPITCATPVPPRTGERSKTPDAPEEENEHNPKKRHFDEITDALAGNNKKQNKGIHILEDLEDAELDEEVIKMTPDERNAIVTRYKKIVQLIPSIKEDAQFYREDPDALCDLIRY